MMLFSKKGYLVELAQDRIRGIEVSRGRARPAFDESIDGFEALPRKVGKGILLISSDSLLNQVIPVPRKGKVNLRTILFHEAESLSGVPPSRLAIGWRSMGIVQEDGISKDIYLLSTYPRDELVAILDRLRRKGIRIEKVVGWLDLLIELGMGLAKKGGKGMLVFESKGVHFLFFKDGIYGFHRTFEMEEELSEELILEIQRSLYYAKQRYKSIVDEINILLPPPWLDEGAISRIRESLSLPVRLIPYRLEREPVTPFSLLNLMVARIGIASNLLNILPAEILRKKQMRSISRAFVAMELCLIVLLVLWTYNNHTLYRMDYSIYQKKLSSLNVLEESLKFHREKSLRLQDLKEQATEVKDFLKKRPFANLYLQTFSYITPPMIHLESIRWSKEEGEEHPVSTPTKVGRTQKKASVILIVSGRIDSERSDERYASFLQFLDNIKKVPSVEMVKYDSEKIFNQGTFEINLRSDMGNEGK